MNESYSGRSEAEYVYTDVDGRPIHKTTRWGKGTSCPFSQSHADPDHPGQWISGLDGTETVLYKLPKVIAAVNDHRPVFIVEGEKDADNMESIGFTATTNPMGAGKWKDDYSRWLQGADVIIIPDNDEPGHKHLLMVARSLTGVANSIRYIDWHAVYQPLPEHGDITDYLHAVATSIIEAQKKVNELAQAAIPWTEAAEQDTWADPIPFDTVVLPPFPVQCLPHTVREFVRDIAEATQTPSDRAGTAALAALAACIQGKYCIRGKEDWYEPLNLYCLSIADPAERKSAVLRFLSEPIIDYERRINEEHKAEVNRNRAEKKRLEKAVETLTAKAAHDPGQFKGELEKAQDELTDFQELHPLRLLADDATSEALTSLLADNNGKLAVFSAEGGIFEILKGRYTKGLNIDTFLKAHSSEEIRVDRKGRSSEYIPHPCLTILLSVQPTVLDGLVSNGDFRGRGLVGRFLYSWPESMVGTRRFDTRSISTAHKADYHKLCEQLLEFYEPETPEVIELSPEAADLSRAFAENLEPHLNRDLYDVKDFAGKLHGAVLRIAGILHIAATTEFSDLASPEPKEVPVSETTMKAAIALGEYFLAHAQKAYQVMGADEQSSGAKYVLRKLRDQDEKRMKRHDIYRLCRSANIQQPTDIEPYLSLLTEYGYLRALPPQPHDTVGRKPDIVYDLNPKLFER